MCVRYDFIFQIATHFFQCHLLNNLFLPLTWHILSSTPWQHAHRWIYVPRAEGCFSVLFLWMLYYCHLGQSGLAHRRCFINVEWTVVACVRHHITWCIRLPGTSSCAPRIFPNTDSHETTNGVSWFSGPPNDCS